MATKKKKAAGYMFPANMPKRVEPDIPQEPVQPTVDSDTPTSEPEPVPVTEPEIIPEKRPEINPVSVHPVEPKPHKEGEVDMDVYKGTGPDNGIILCAILLGLILIGLIFLIWHETNWKNQEDQNNQNEQVNVEPEYDGLRLVISNYVKDMKDPNKSEYLNQIRNVYIEAAKSNEKDINKLIDDIYTKTHDILGFEKPRRQTRYEWEYQKLFDNTGVINTWLLSSNVVITSQNKKAVFMAIAEGLK